MKVLRQINCKLLKAEAVLFASIFILIGCSQSENSASAIGEPRATPSIQPPEHASRPTAIGKNKQRGLDHNLNLLIQNATQAHDKGEKNVAVRITATNPFGVVESLKPVGLTNAKFRDGLISGNLPINSLHTAASTIGVKGIRPDIRITRSGSAQSQGDIALRSDEARDLYGVTGDEQTIGVLSDSYDCLLGAQLSVNNGELPPDVVVIEDAADCTEATDEGRAMVEIIHDLAPGAKILFQTAWNGAIQFANGIQKLVDAGADIIVDDTMYLAEPMFQAGHIARAAEDAVENGVPFISAVGNNGAESYSSSFVPDPTAPNYHLFDSEDGRWYQAVYVELGQPFTSVLQWDDPFYSATGTSGALTDLDFYLIDFKGNILASGEYPNVGDDPWEILSWTNDGTVDADEDGAADDFFAITIVLHSGPQPSHMKHVITDGYLWHDWSGSESTIFGHSNSNSIFGVGTSNYFDTPRFGSSRPELAWYSSIGSTPLLFSSDGTRLTDPVLPSQPRAIAADGGNTSFFGTDIADDSDEFPNFFGTSAAAAHVAAIGALVNQRAGRSLMPVELYSALESGAIDMNEAGTDPYTGVGLIQANLVLASVKTDRDGDGIEDALDNCPDAANESQSNHDDDAMGDECDNDDDNDGMLDSYELDNDLNPFVDDGGSDKDGDGITNLEEALLGTRADSVDSDDDGLHDGVDQLPNTPSNICEGDHAVLAGLVTATNEIVQCSAQGSIQVAQPSNIATNSTVQLFSPAVRMLSGVHFPIGTKLLVSSQPANKP